MINLTKCREALSYDALRQMAVAIHVSHPLTFVFPAVVDGFIIYGVRGLLVMRDASFIARTYVWALFSTATAASIWANALRAVRLNQEGLSGAGLRLGDTTVGVLSTIAPLALAGAVHLYILIARHAATPAHQLAPIGDGGHVHLDRAAPAGHRTAAVSLTASPTELTGHPSTPAVADRPDNSSPDSLSAQPTGQAATSRSSGRPAGRAGQAPIAEAVSAVMPDQNAADDPSDDPADLDGQPGSPTGQLINKAGRLTGWPVTGRSGEPAAGAGAGQVPAEPVSVGQPLTADRDGEVMTGQPGGHLAAPVTTNPVTSNAVTSANGPEVADRDAERNAPAEGDAPPGQDLLPLARSAVEAAGRTSRAVVATAIRGQGLTLSSDRLTELMRRLREEPIDSKPPATS